MIVKLSNFAALYDHSVLVTMKSTAQKSAPAIGMDLEKLSQKAASAKKAAQKSLEAYEAEDKKYQDAIEHKLEKLELLRYAAALKIARFSYKIKNTEYKLAKSSLKHAQKALKKSGEKAEKTIQPAEGKPSKARKSGKKNA